MALLSDVTVACVLRSGGDFGTEYVNRLRSGVAEHAPSARWVCLSDVPEVATHPLWHEWPGWWSKIELFRPGLLTGKTLYLDLDTSAVGNLAPLVESIRDDRFLMLADFFKPDTHHGSGVMGWQGDWSALYYAFAADVEAHVRTYSTRHRWGDQAFIAERLNGRLARWQDVVPGMVRSYKRECQHGVPHGTRLVVFHGRPRPHEIGWAI